jgi:hypothetical protein
MSNEAGQENCPMLSNTCLIAVPGGPDTTAIMANDALDNISNVGTLDDKRIDLHQQANKTIG